MPNCKGCQTFFPKNYFDGTRYYDFRHRVYCVACSPIGSRRKCGPKPNPEGRMKGRLIEFTCYCGKKHKNKNAQRLCSTCSVKKQRHKRRKWAIEKLGGKCIICGCDKHYCLDFHHKNPSEKTFSLSSFWHYNIEMLKKEIEKCELICANCHREIHYLENNPKLASSEDIIP